MTVPSQSVQSPATAVQKEGYEVTKFSVHTSESDTLDGHSAYFLRLILILIFDIGPIGAFGHGSPKRGTAVAFSLGAPV